MSMNNKNRDYPTPVDNLFLPSKSQTLYTELNTKSKELGRMFLGIWLALRNEDNPEALVQAAHSARELIEKSPKFLPQFSSKLPLEIKSNSLEKPVRDLCIQWYVQDIISRKSKGSYVGEIDANINRVLAEVEKLTKVALNIKPLRRTQMQEMIKNLDLSSRPLSDYITNNQVARFMELKPEFNNIAHHRFKITREDFEKKVAELENLLLDLLNPRPLRGLDKIDELIQQAEATGSQNKINKAITEIQNSQAVYEHFFDSISKSDWIHSLITAGIFDSPDDVIRYGNSVSFSIWQPIIYLEKVATKAPEQVNQALLRIKKALLKSPVNQNAWLHDAYVRTLSRLPANLILHHIQIVKEFIKNEFMLLMPRELLKLIQRLTSSEDKYLKVAEEVANAALDVRPNPTFESLTDNQKIETLMNSVTTHFEAYDYQQIVAGVVDYIGQNKPRLAIEIFSKLLVRTIKFSSSANGQSYDYHSASTDYSSIRCDIAREHPHPRHELVTGLRLALEFLMQNKGIAINEKTAIIKEIAHRQDKIFARLSEFILREYKNQHEYQNLYTQIAELAEAEKEWDESELQSIHPQPKLNAEKLLAVSQAEAAQIIKSYKSSRDIFHCDELSISLSSCIKINPVQTLNIIRKLSDANWDVQYAILDAFAGQIDEMKEQTIGHFVDYIWNLSNHFDTIEKGNAPFSNPINGKKVIIRIVHKLINQKEDKTEYVNLDTGRQLIAIILRLTRDDIPAPSDAVIHGEDNIHLFTFLINTTQGAALNTIAHAILWMRRHKVAVEDELFQQIYSELDWHLDLKNDPSPAIRLLYGKWIPWILDANKEWVEDNLDNIFTADEQGDIAWEAYFRFNIPYRDVLQLLKPKLGSYLDRLTEGALITTGTTEAHRSLAQHMMTHFIRKELLFEDNDSLLQHFFALPLQYSVESLRFIGIELKKNHLNPSKEQITRLQDLFQRRLDFARERCREPNQAKKQKWDIAEFGSWFASGKLPDEWSWNMLIETLTITQYITPDFWVFERLQSLGQKYPDNTIKVLSLMIAGAPERWSISSWERNLVSILEVVCDSNSVTARASAIDLIETLVAKGYHEYRELAKKCSKSLSNSSSKSN